MIKFGWKNADGRTRMSIFGDKILIRGNFFLLARVDFQHFKRNIRQQNWIITVRMQLFPLMAGSENICEISALID